MSQAPAPAAAPKPSRLRYLVVVVLTAAGVALVTALLINIFQRKQEAQQHFFKVVELDEDTLDPKEWGKNFPRHYDTYKLTVDTQRTRHGGSDAIDKLEQQPLLKRLYAGYAFSIDFRE
jgi:nitrite reductase (cytochrome c-552)